MTHNPDINLDLVNIATVFQCYVQDPSNGQLPDCGWSVGVTSETGHWCKRHSYRRKGKLSEEQPKYSVIQSDFDQSHMICAFHYSTDEE